MRWSPDKVSGILSSEEVVAVEAGRDADGSELGEANRGEVGEAGAVRCRRGWRSEGRLSRVTRAQAGLWVEQLRGAERERVWRC